MKWRTLLLLALAECLAMGLWFSATAVAPALVRDWALSPTQGAWLTMAVQLGFVTGALLSALFNVPDLWQPRVVVALGAFAGAGLTVLIPALHASFATAIVRGSATRSRSSRGGPISRSCFWSLEPISLLQLLAPHSSALLPPAAPAARPDEAPEIT